MNDLKVTPASRSFTADFLLLGLAVVILMVIEARKHGVKFVWLYIVGGYVIALSVTFPLFLIAREVRMDTSDARGLRKTDLALLVVVAALGAVQIIWVLTV
jgi:Terpene cyclase DEP1